MMRKWIYPVIMVVILSIGTTGGMSKAETTQKKLVVTSLHQRIDYGKQILIYEGEVKATWENVILEADRVEVYLTEERELKKVIATGKVWVKQLSEKREATCESVTYTAEDDKLFLEEKVHYQDDLGNELSAVKVAIWLDREKMEAEGLPVKAVYSLEEGERIGTEGGETY
ncbi:MAG: LptA/OstA family protein [Candidatus Aerophobetes bacterium]|nr:LptA/OstA family protein [Candidatus Aerophobetes bacterium]